MPRVRLLLHGGLRDQAVAGGVPFPGRQQHLVPSTLWLGTWHYNPSEGLLLKFSGDIVYLVLIRGSNLDQPLNEGPINLTQAGLQRHRVLWLREMSEEEIRQVGETGPTIDRIQVAEFESAKKHLKEWLEKDSSSVFAASDGKTLFPADRIHWCGRGESNPHEHFQPYGFSYQLRFSPPP